MNFKKLISRAALAAALAAVPAMAQTWSHLIDTETGRDYGSNGMVTNTYYGLTHKFVDGNTFTTELLNDLEYRAARKDKIKFKHGALRFVYSINDIATFAEDHKFSLGFRYRAPTSTTEQLQGSFGQLLIRPTLKGKLGAVEYMLRESVGPFLQRQRATRNQKIGPAGSATANPLWTAYTELGFGIPLGIEGLAFNTLFTHLNVYYGKANNAVGYLTSSFEQDYEIRMAFASLDGLEVALATVNNTKYGKVAGGAKPGSPDNKLGFNEGSTYAIRLTKGF